MFNVKLSIYNLIEPTWSNELNYLICAASHLYSQTSQSSKLVCAFYPEVVSSIPTHDTWVEYFRMYRYPKCQVTMHLNVFFYQFLQSGVTLARRYDYQVPQKQPCWQWVNLQSSVRWLIIKNISQLTYQHYNILNYLTLLVLRL